MIKISKRLKDIINHLDSQDHIIDIGCDHAKFSIYLIEYGYYNHIYVSDNKQSALSGAIDNIKENGLEDKITTLLGNGLEVINNDIIDTVVISGLGTSTIKDILSNKKINQIKKLVIQSNNNHEELRIFLESIGFFINKETCVFDNNKYYLTISFLRGDKKLNSQELKYGISNNKDYYLYLLDNLKKIKGKRANLDNSYINNEIAKITEIIRNIRWFLLYKITPIWLCYDDVLEYNSLSKKGNNILK